MDLLKASTQTELDCCMAIRRLVFIDEQRVPEDLEVDDHDRLGDPIADHFLFLVDDQPIGTVRCLKKPDGVLKIGRVAVMKEERGKGRGHQMMDLIEASYPTMQRFVLDAQTHAIPFYLKCGYEAIGEDFLEAGIQHRHMEKRNPGFVNLRI
jgi:predicted GNAT family N-acyltransferase